MSVTDLAREAASRYLAMVPMRQMITDEVAERIARSQTPPELRDELAQRSVDLLHEAVTRIFVDQAVAHFTVSELHALVRFYGSPEGRSVLLKTLSFTRDLSAAIDAEIRGWVPPAS